MVDHTPKNKQVNQGQEEQGDSGPMIPADMAYELSKRAAEETALAMMQENQRTAQSHDRGRGRQRYDEDDDDQYVDNKVLKQVQNIATLFNTVKEFTANPLQMTIERKVGDLAASVVENAFMPRGPPPKRDFLENILNSQFALGFGSSLGQRTPEIIDTLTKNFGSARASQIIDGVVNRGMPGGPPGGGQSSQHNNVSSSPEQSSLEMLLSLDPNNPEHVATYCEAQGGVSPDIGRKMLIIQQDDIIKKMKNQGARIPPEFDRRNYERAQEPTSPPQRSNAQRPETFDDDILRPKSQPQQQPQQQPQSQQERPTEEKSSLEVLLSLDQDNPEDLALYCESQGGIPVEQARIMLPIHQDAIAKTMMVKGVPLPQDFVIRRQRMQQQTVQQPTPNPIQGSGMQQPIQQQRSSQPIKPPITGGAQIQDDPEIQEPFPITPPYVQRSSPNTHVQEIPNQITPGARQQIPQQLEPQEPFPISRPNVQQPTQGVTIQRPQIKDSNLEQELEDQDIFESINRNASTPELVKESDTNNIQETDTKKNIGDENAQLEAMKTFAEQMGKAIGGITDKIESLNSNYTEKIESLHNTITSLQDQLKEMKTKAQPIEPVKTQIKLVEPPSRLVEKRLLSLDKKDEDQSEDLILQQGISDKTEYDGDLSGGYIHQPIEKLNNYQEDKIEISPQMQYQNVQEIDTYQQGQQPNMELQEIDFYQQGQQPNMELQGRDFYHQGFQQPQHNMMPQIPITPSILSGPVPVPEYRLFPVNSQSPNNQAAQISPTSPTIISVRPETQITEEKQIAQNNPIISKPQIQQPLSAQNIFDIQTLLGQTYPQNIPLEDIEIEIDEDIEEVSRDKSIKKDIEKVPESQVKELDEIKSEVVEKGPQSPSLENKDPNKEEINKEEKKFATPIKISNIQKKAKPLFKQ